ncbi:hypothetical protein SK803_19195 [Lentzea sp. BCCO 10_0856]|uniref:Coenzyme PQQ synthesis protein D (PqqD) n=1 Tax=Lentzea miocenica TaxID=3095431 RepID=A0ABU4T2G6_9PSEU|nr:hypothetical protein [Lentzea sp. BCCO 10_0856]MDX8032346.1 hypothetical protein [Lentzea sp. BCCO 10_0856]
MSEVPDLPIANAECRVLGPLEVLLDGEPVTVPAGRGRVLPATLLLRPNQFVSVAELADRLWDGEPPTLALGLFGKVIDVATAALENHADAGDADAEDRLRVALAEVRRRA